MAISTTTCHTIYVGNNSTAIAYPINWPYLDPAHIAVMIRPKSGGEFVPFYGFTVLEAGNPRVVTHVPIYDVYDVLVMRVTPRTQLSIYPEAGTFPAKSHETALDRLTMIAQEDARDKELFPPPPGEQGPPGSPGTMNGLMFLNVVSEDTVVPSDVKAFGLGNILVEDGATLTMAEGARGWLLGNAEFSDSGSDPGPEPADQPAPLRHYWQVIGDPANSVGVVFHTNGTDNRVRYRKLGETDWQTAMGGADNFPGRPERVVMAALTGLEAETIYQVRPWGTTAGSIVTYQTRKSALGGGTFQIAFLADIQDSVGAGSHFAALSALVVNDDPDFVVWGGDYGAPTPDDGVVSTNHGDNWVLFLERMTELYVRSNGCGIAWVGIAGNHEALPGVVGSQAYIHKLFQFPFRPTANRFAMGGGYLRWGNEAILFFFDNSFCSLPSAQIPGALDVLGNQGSEVKHLLTFSHYPAFMPGYQYSPAIRRQFITELQDYAGARFCFNGHIHAIYHSHPVKFLTDETDGNNFRWYRDDDGIIFTGAGFGPTMNYNWMGGFPLPASTVPGHAGDAQYDILVDVDNPAGSPPNQRVFGTLESALVESPAVRGVGAKHYHRITLSASEIKVEIVNRNGAVYKTSTRSIT